MDEQRRLAAPALAAGKTHTASFAHRPTGWRVRCHRAPMLKNSELSASAYSQGAWRRELGLTLYAGQHLPGQLYGGNSLELYHPVSGVRISFCALEALRSWAGLDCAPVPHLSPSAPLPAWDYTFTTAYPGAVAVAPPGAGVPSQPDGTTFYARAAVDLADGPARLRRPLCKCRGASGRPPLVPVSDPHPLADCEPAPPSPPPPPRWRRAAEELDLASLLRGRASRAAETLHVPSARRTPPLRPP